MKNKLETIFTVLFFGVALVGLVLVFNLIKHDKDVSTGYIKTIESIEGVKAKSDLVTNYKIKQLIVTVNTTIDVDSDKADKVLYKGLLEACTSEKLDVVTVNILVDGKPQATGSWICEQLK